MKNLFTLLCTLLCLNLGYSQGMPTSGQPAEFSFTTDCSNGEATAFVQVTFDGQPLAEDTHVAVFTSRDRSIAGSNTSATFGSFEGILRIVVNIEDRSVCGDIGPDGGVSGCVNTDSGEGCEQIGFIIAQQKADGGTCFIVVEGFVDFAVGEGRNGRVIVEGYGQDNLPNNQIAVTSSSICYDNIEDAITALPVTLRSFSGSSDAKAVNLAWNTGVESGNDYFTVERSTDGREFKSIGTVDGAGDTNAGASYEFADYDAAIGTNYYRLRQTDFDGTVNAINQVIAVDFRSTSAADDSRVYPNPATSELNINLGAAWGEGDVRAELFNVKGQSVGRYSVRAGSSNVITIQDYPAGLYQLRLSNNAKSAAHRIVIR